MDLEKRCHWKYLNSSGAPFPKRKPHDFKRFMNYRNQWDCIFDYERRLQDEYLYLGVIFTVLTALSFCTGGLHFGIHLEYDER